MLTAIVVAGGSSQRMGFDKLLVRVAGKPVVTHALAAFEEAPSVTNIILVGRAERLSDYEKAVEAEAFAKVSVVIPGGVRRQDSVRCGLQQLDPAADFVAVHDAARALVGSDLIERIFRLASAHGGAASATPVIDTLKRVDDAHFVTGGVERNNLFAVQTPQMFSRSLLEKAYDAVFAKGIEVTDEISAVERIGGRVALLPNDEPNFKITYPADLTLAEFILQQRGKARKVSDDS